MSEGLIENSIHADCIGQAGELRSEVKRLQQALLDEVERSTTLEADLHDGTNLHTHEGMKALNARIVELERFLHDEFCSRLFKHSLCEKDHDPRIPTYPASYS